jgi:hypothetical protein
MDADGEKFTLRLRRDDAPAAGTELEYLVPGSSTRIIPESRTR